MRTGLSALGLLIDLEPKQADLLKRVVGGASIPLEAGMRRGRRGSGLAASVLVTSAPEPGFRFSSSC